MNQNKNSSNSQELNNYFQSTQPKINQPLQISLKSAQNQIVNKISDGEVSLGKTKNLPMKEFEQSLKQKHIEQIKRQKKQLQQKLAELNQSIQQCFVQQNLSNKNYKTLNTVKQKGKFQMKQSLKRQHQWRKRQQARKQDLLTKKKKIEEKIESKLSVLSSQKVRQINAQKQKKKKQIQTNIDKFKLKLKEREEQIKIQRQKIQQIKNKTKIFQKLEEEYKVKKEQEFAEKKRKLNEWHSWYKPINHDQLLQHEQKFLKLQQHREQQRKKLRYLSENKANSYEVPYESQFYKRVLINQSRLSEHTQNPNKSIRKLKIKQYEEHLKQNHQPIISQKKKFQIQSKNKAKIHNLNLINARKEEQSIKTKIQGKENLDYIRKIKKKQKVQIVQQPLAIKYQNYLKRTEKKAQDGDRWDNILMSKKYDQQMKLHQIQLQSQRVQMKLKLKQKQNQTSKGQRYEQLDEQYFTMIKAKIKILNDVHE